VGRALARPPRRDAKYFGSDDNAADENLLANQVVLYQEKRGATPEQALEMFQRSQEDKIGRRRATRRRRHAV